MKTPLVLPRISENDKTTSTDGFLEVYSDEAMRKDQIEGSISVQVKGYTQKLKTIDHLKYSVEIADLNNFETVCHGAIYFVVALDKQGETKEIFYKQFLPYDIESIRRQASKPGQKTITVRFRPFPNDRRSIERICIEFLREKKNQGSTILVNGAITPDELKEHGVVVGSYSWSKTLYKGEGPTSLAPYDNGVYMYAVDKHTGMKYAVGWYEAVEKIQAIQKHVISAGEVSVDANVGVSINGGTATLEFGCFSLSFGEDAKIHYKETGGFRQRLASARLLKALINSEELRVDGEVLCSGLTDVNVNVGSLEERIEIHSVYARMEDELHSRIDFDPNDLAESDFWALDRLVDAVVFGKTYKSDRELSVVSNIDICNKRVKVVCQELDDGTYKLSDLLNGQFSYSFGFPPSGIGADEEMVPVPALLSLSEEDYACVINIDSERFAADLERMPLSVNISDAVTQKLLEMLNAWDSGAVCSKDLIECCKHLSRALHDINCTDESLINMLQVDKRIGILSQSDNESLMRVLVGNSNNWVKAACYLLIDRLDDAEQCINELNDDERAEFERWPINRYRNKE